MISFPDQLHNSNLIRKAVRGGLIGTGVVICLLSLVRLWLTTTHGYGTSFISGAWFSLANDMNAGLFYRPMYLEQLGFGGTRYFPVFFALLGLLIKVVGQPFYAGVVITVIASVALVLGLFRVLRVLGLTPGGCFALATLPFSSNSIQSCIDTLRCDLLSSGLSVWGIYFFLRWRTTNKGMVISVICFLLAFATKMTALYGGAASVVILWAFWRKDLRLFTLMGSIGVVLFAGVLWWASSGRAIGILLATPDGGTTLGSLVRGPWIALTTMSGLDRGCFLTVLLASSALLLSSWRHEKAVIPCAMLISLAILSVVFASPGAWINHFVDVLVMSYLVLGLLISMQGSELTHFILTSLLFIGLFSTALLFRSTLVYDMKRDQINDAMHVVEYVGKGSQPVISEDPLIPIVSGERVVTPEPYMVRVLSNKSRAFRDTLTQQLRARTFRAIVLLKDPEKAGDWYTKNHFGASFISELEANYVQRKVVGQYLVYLPK